MSVLIAERSLKQNLLTAQERILELQCWQEMPRKPQPLLPLTKDRVYTKRLLIMMII